MKLSRIVLMVGLWIYLGLLVIVWKAFPSKMMNIVFFVGAVSMFVTGAVTLYRQRPRQKR